MPTNKYTWLLNLHGIRVEVETRRVEELLADGYKVAGPLIRKTKLSVDAQFITLNYFPFEGYGRLQQLLDNNITFNPQSKNKFVLGYPHSRLINEEEKLIFYTMFEADKIPDEWTIYSNLANALIVPSTFCKDSFENSGVEVPIHVVPLGTDNFEVYEKPEGVFTFLHYDFTSAFDRKGGDLVLKTFLDLFGNNKNCRLILKGRKHNFPFYKKYPNVEYIFDNYNRYEMDELSRKAHCFVFPSRGEGFGLPPLESMAHSIPTILTDAHGQKDFAYLGIPLKAFGLMPSQYDGLSNCGSWVKPYPNHLKELMLDVFNNYESYKEEALKNQPKIKELYDFGKISELLVKTINDIVSKSTK